MDLQRHNVTDKANLVIISALKAKNVGLISAEAFDAAKGHTIAPDKFFLVFSDHSFAQDVTHHNGIVLNARNQGDAMIPVVDVTVGGKKYHASLVHVAAKQDLPTLFPESRTHYVHDMQDVGAELLQLTKPNRKLREIPVAERTSVQDFLVDRTATPLSRQH
jgi:hypothetical protein